MLRDRQTEAQLTVMASSADRANRPRMLVVVFLLLAIAAVVLVLAMWFRFSSSRSLLEQRLTELESVRSYADASRELEGSGIDLEELFPDNPRIADEIAQIADMVTGPAAVDKIQVNQANYRPIAVNFGGSPNLRVVTVRCTFTSAKTQDIFNWIEQVQRTPGLDGTFVNSIDLVPRDPGRWTGTVEFKRYVYQEGTR